VLDWTYIRVYFDAGGFPWVTDEPEGGDAVSNEPEYLLVQGDARIPKQIQGFFRLKSSTVFDMIWRDRPGSCDPRPALTTNTLLVAKHVMATSYPTAPVANFKRIPGATGYALSADGLVWTCKTNRGGIGVRWKTLKPKIDRTTGYLSVNFWESNKKRTLLLHSLMLEVFIGPRPDGMQACHNDGDKSNSAIENLRWDTRQGNEADKVKHRTKLTGSKVTGSVLVESRSPK